MTLNKDEKYGFKKPQFIFNTDQKSIIYDKQLEQYEISRIHSINSTPLPETQPEKCIFCTTGMPCKEHGKKISQLKELKENNDDTNIKSIIKQYDLFQSKEIPSTRMTRIYRLPNGEYSVRAPAEDKWDIQSLRTYLEFPEFSKFITGTLSQPPKQIGEIHLVHDVRDIEVGKYITPTGANAYEVVGKVDSTPLTMPPATGLEAVIFFEINK